MEASLKKQLRKQNKWKRGLSRKLVEDILTYDPDFVQFDIEYPEVIRCIIKTPHGIGTGIAICSVLDMFDEKRGKHLAAGRALKAIVNGTDSELIRCDHGFPLSWTFRQAGRVSKFSDLYWKSQFVYEV
jgi:hypothetical protein